MPDALAIASGLPPGARPVAIGGMAGWLHEGGAHGVVLCGGHGFEALSAHLGWHVLASLLARSGLTVLRFDYPGDGDSLDVPQGESMIAAAIAGTRAAVDWLAAQPGIARVSCVALRIGALFAAEALRDWPALDSLVLLAPPVSGRAYVRELGITAKLFAEVRNYPSAPNGAIDLCGYRVEASDSAELLRLKAGTWPAARRLLVVDRPGQTTVATGWDDPGEKAAERREFDDYAAFMQDPSRAVTPFATFNAVADWLAGPDQPTSDAVEPVLPTSPAEAITGPNFSEERLIFGTNRHLAGVICRPLVPRADKASLIILNAGANSHEGWARGAVEQARRLAGDGITSLRFDLSGLGDSIWFENGPRPHLYSEQHIRDAIEAVDLMEGLGYAHPLLSGLCAGGYVAFHAAARDGRIKKVVTANVLRLIWTAEDSLEAYERQVIQTLAAYREQFKSGRALRRILSGEVPLKRMAEVGAKFASGCVSRLAARLGVPMPLSEPTRQVRAMLTTLMARGASIVFVHSALDQSLSETERHFGPGFAFARQQKGTVFMTIPSADHELTPIEARMRYLDIIRRQLTGD